jgi:hypothetical protein
VAGLPCLPDELGGDGTEASGIRYHTLVHPPSVYHEVG